MDTAFLARLQFAFTISFHYIYPPLSIGLGLVLVMMEGMYLKTKDKKYEEMTRFWVKIFSLTFAMGVATGIVMEFEFGTNWATYSRFVGDVFGSALASEGIFAFFLESGFLAILVFGWDKVSPKLHFFSTLMVSIGSMLSALWIVVANSWQQTPSGFHIVHHNNIARAEITDFWAMVLNPSSIQRFSHTVSGAWLSGAFLVISVSAFYLLKKQHTEFAKSSLKIGLTVALFASLFQLFTGHQSAAEVSTMQPAKLAAFEAHFDSLAPANMHLFGWVNEKAQTVNYGIQIPGLLSFLVHGDTKAPVRGINSFPKNDLPPVNFVFQTYHFMVAIGMTLILISLLSFYFIWKNKIVENKWWLRILVISVLLPEIANQLGWFSAEVGRQPWVVYGLLRTSEGLSKAVESGQIVFSLVLFTFIYLLLFVLFIFLLDHKIKAGPGHSEEIESEYDKQKELFAKH
ncbi:MAG: cytochrome ubiquinol oxidase subunit I [Bacteroidota bacterium]|nr:cytochrome ubiquinol oxidase subunit I [Bacteroidota bacterium]MDP4196636.1 cytochrome ubiquinol oxidase subunit I [Bacteroidota bacterium]